jgi:hypothetical protein
VSSRGTRDLVVRSHEPEVNPPAVGYQLSARGLVTGDRVIGESNFLNLKFLNFPGIRNGRKFAVSPSPVLTDSSTPRLLDSSTFVFIRR